MEDYEIVGKLEELLEEVKKIKEESDAKARYWAMVYTKLEDALAWVKVYCVEDEDAN